MCTPFRLRVTLHLARTFPDLGARLSELKRRQTVYSVQFGIVKFFVQLNRRDCLRLQQEFYLSYATHAQALGGNAYRARRALASQLGGVNRGVDGMERCVRPRR